MLHTIKIVKQNNWYALIKMKGHLTKVIEVSQRGEWTGIIMMIIHNEGSQYSNPIEHWLLKVIPFMNIAVWSRIEQMELLILVELDFLRDYLRPEW